MRPTRTDETVSPPEEPAATPLFSVADIAITDFPTVHIPQRQVFPIEQHAQRIASQSPGSVEDHRTGKVGEYAFAKALGVEDEIDFEVYADGGDGGSDFKSNGATIDAKTASQCHVNPSLMVDAYEPLRADYYALTSRISKTDVRLIGVAPRKFVANAPVWEHDGDAYHHVDQEYLSPFPPSLI